MMVEEEQAPMLIGRRMGSTVWISCSIYIHITV